MVLAFLCFFLSLTFIGVSMVFGACGVCWVCLPFLVSSVFVLKCV